MSSKQFAIKVDPRDGKFWLVMLKPGQQFRRLADVTDQVVLALVADLTYEGGVRAIERDVTFADGKTFRITIEDTSMVPLELPKAA